jgi:hypothetical protein
MNKHFDYYFPPSEYNPLDLIKIENEHSVITRLKFEATKNSYTYVSTVLKQNVYSQMTPDEGVFFATITVPLGKIVQVVKRCNDNPEDVITCFCGPVKIYFTHQGLFASECYVRETTVEGTDTLRHLAEEFVECQRKLIIRLYSEKLFNNFQFKKAKYRDIPITTELEYPNFLRYQSMIVPYGIYINNVGELVLNPKKLTELPSLKSGKLNGPCLISDTSELYVYYQQSYIHTVIHEEGPFEKNRISTEDLEKLIPQLIPPKTVVVTNKHIKIQVRLSHYMYEQLQPLLGMYFISKCLGEEYTKLLIEDSTWKLDDDNILRLALFWLVKSMGDYSYIAPIFNNPRYNKICSEALSIYSKKTQY